MPKISEARREARREAIMDATVACLAAHGYAGTSMRVIANAAGMTKGGLYAYFENKEAILLAVAERQMREQLAELHPEPGESASEQLAALFASYQKTNRDPDAVPTQRAIFDLWNLMIELPPVRQALDDRYRTYVDTIAGVIRRGQDAGEFARDVDPVLLAALIVATRDGMVYHAIELGLPVPLVRLTERLREMVVNELKVDR
jgi:AcrR family transcriptional regulator